MALPPLIHNRIRKATRTLHITRKLRAFHPGRISQVDDHVVGRNDINEFPEEEMSEKFGGAVVGLAVEYLGSLKEGRRGMEDRLGKVAIRVRAALTRVRCAGSLIEFATHLASRMGRRRSARSMVER